jgi:uncharacterized 2Fe-2S/4Fe-4S cluster protein (DUF4445 family)
MLVFTGKNARKVMKKRAKLLTIWAATGPAQEAGSRL